MALQGVWRHDGGIGEVRERHSRPHIPLSPSPLRPMLFILNNFQPDEYAHEPVSPEVLSVLQQEHQQQQQQPPALSLLKVDLSRCYCPPHVDAILPKV